MALFTKKRYLDKILLLFMIEILLHSTCSHYVLPDMVIQSIKPHYIYNGEDTSVTILGRNFIPEIKMDDAGGDVVIKGRFSIRIFNEESEMNNIDVEFIDFSTLKFTIAAGSPKGVYSLELTDPEGRSAFLDDAIEIVTVKADHMEVEFSMKEAEVGTWVTAYLQLVDTSGNPLPQARDVTVTLDRETGRFGENSIEGEIEGTTMTGKLDTDGSGWIEVTDDTVEELTLCADAWDDAQGQENLCDTVYFTPGELAGFVIDTIDSPQIAGEPFLITIRAIDEDANQVVDFNGKVSIQDFSFSITPRVSSNFLSGSVEEMVTIWRIYDDDVIVVADLSGNTGVSNTFDVIPTEIAYFRVRGPGRSVRAGEIFSIIIEAKDELDNTIEGFNQSVDISDLTGTITPAHADGFINGILRVDSSITRSMNQNRITVKYEEIGGESEPFDVLAAQAVRFTVRLTDIVQEVNEKFLLSISAVDDYGNINMEFAGIAYLYDETSTISPETTDDFVEGEATIPVIISETIEENRIRVETDEGLYGTSDTFSVYDFNCDESPLASLLIDGSDHGVACYTGSPVDFDYDTSGSEGGGGRELIDILLDFGDGEYYRSFYPFYVVHEYDGIGRFKVSMVVADEGLCASRVGGAVYIGENDGSPTGPIEIETTHETLYAGEDSSQAESSISMMVRDCSGDPSQYHAITVQIDRGAVVETDEDASEMGLQFMTDSWGNATCTISVEEESLSGLLTIAAVGNDGIAFGMETIQVENDTEALKVIDFYPTGFITEFSPPITVYFSEEVMETTINSHNISLSGYSGDIFLETIEYDSDDHVIYIYPYESLDPMDEYYTLFLSSNLRDLSGNFLDGDYDGTGGGEGDDFSFSFGAVEEANTPYILSFDTLYGTFSPDGQDGVDAGEPDSEVIYIEGCDDSGISLLQLFIYDELDDLIRVLSRPAETCELHSFSWNGRNEEGRVVGNGYYRVVPVIYDIYFNKFVGEELMTNVQNPIDWDKER